VSAQTRRGFFGRAFGGLLAAVGLGKVAAKGCGSPYCYRPGCWTGPRPPRDLTLAKRRQAQEFADYWDSQALKALRRAVRAGDGWYLGPSK